MTAALRRLLVLHCCALCLACLLPGFALAQQGRRLPEGLSRDEIKALELRGLGDPAFGAWERLPYYAGALSSFRRAGRLARCPAVMAFTPDDYYFDPALRAALDAVVDRHLDGRFDPLGLEDFRYIERSLLWAQRHTPAAHWQTLLRLAQSPPGQRALQRQRAMRVMEDYPERAIDLDTGQPLAYMPIALKTYLAQSGQLDAFERALQAAAPHISADFAQVRTLRQYADEHAAKPAAADLVRLKRLSYFLGEGLYSVRKAFLANLPEEERRTLAELEAAPFLPLYADALQATRHPDIPWFVLPEPLTASRLGEPKFDGITYGDRGHRFYTDFVRASMDSEYPPSAERQARYERLKRMTPAQYVNDAHRAFCPAGP